MKPSPPSLGTWMSIGAPAIAELAGKCGFDWVLFDLEHGMAAEAALPDQLRALRGTGCKAIVRVGAGHPEWIARVLDWGAEGIMVPQVESAAEAEAVVRACRFPPRGTRGYAPTVPAFSYGLQDGRSAVDPLVIPQIESLAGVEAVEEIARVDGVDVLFVGPVDLKLNLESVAEPAYDDCLDRVAAAASAAGKRAGMLTATPEEVTALHERGFTWIAWQTDIGLLRDAYQSLLKGLDS